MIWRDEVRDAFDRSRATCRVFCKSRIAIGSALILACLTANAQDVDPRALPQPPYCATTKAKSETLFNGPDTVVRVHAGKLVEQRRWTCSYSGTVKIHVRGTTTSEPWFVTESRPQ